VLEEGVETRGLSSRSRRQPRDSQLASVFPALPVPAGVTLRSAPRASCPIVTIATLPLLRRGVDGDKRQTDARDSRIAHFRSRVPHRHPHTHQVSSTH